MPDSEQKNTIEVHSAEGGQKLLQYLMRRLSLPQPLLHRWIRTGQVRINGGRAKPFMHVHAGDTVRLPPFALSMAQSANFDKATQKEQTTEASTSPTPPLLHTDTLPLPPIVYSDETFTIYNKPCGLPVHGGTGHTDSLCARLETHFADAPFKPTPAHRLDKDTSGLICVAFSYTSLRMLQEAFAAHTMGKEYVAWVHGQWPYSEARTLTHTVAKKTIGSMEKMHVLRAKKRTSSLHAEEGKDASCIVQCLQRTKTHSLMHIRLLTGRTHQIRLQLAAEGHSIVGDEKYATTQKPYLRDKKADTKLFLHSLRITLPHTIEDAAYTNLAGKSFTVLPTWENNFRIDAPPLPLLLP